MRRRPGVRQWIARDQASSAEAVTRLQPPSETATERATLAEGPAAEYQRDVDPAPEREVAPNSWRHPRQGKRAPGWNLAGPPRVTRLGFAAGEGNHRVLLESQGGTARRRQSRRLERRGQLAAVAEAGREPDAKDEIVQACVECYDL